MDPSSINKNVRVDVPIIADAGEALEELLAAWRKRRPPARPVTAQDAKKAALAEWWKQVDLWRARKGFAYKASDDVIKPQYAIERLYAATRGATSTSPPKSASTKCGPRNTSTSRSPIAG